MVSFIRKLSILRLIITSAVGGLLLPFFIVRPEVESLIPVGYVLWRAVHHGADGSAYVLMAMSWLVGSLLLFVVLFVIQSIMQYAPGTAEGEGRDDAKNSRPRHIEIRQLMVLIISVLTVGAVLLGFRIYRQVRTHALPPEQRRMNANVLKMLDPAKRAMLSRQDREELFRHNIKTIGLDGPRTPEQEELYQRMYDSMVLNKSGPAPNE